MSTIIFIAIAAIPSIATVTYMLVNDKRDVRKLKTIRQELNDRLEETGSPARYYPKYSDWKWVINYDDDPTEAATEFMERTLNRYNESRSPAVSFFFILLRSQAVPVLRPEPL